MFSVRWSDAATAEFDAIIDYVLLRNETAALRLAKRLLAAGDSLAHFPRRALLIGDRLHQYSLVYPYLIRYRVENEVVHSFRSPRRAPRKLNSASRAAP